MDLSKIRIPFNVPTRSGQEQQYMLSALQKGHISGDGHYTALCHNFIESTFQVPKALLTTSCTHALEMAALLLRLEPGDEVILPSFTFVSTANAFVLRGAVPVFCDIRPDTLNLDEQQLPRLLTPRTKAIVPVHYAGVGCEMDQICAFAQTHQLTVVEDNAHGLFGRYRGRYLGTFGQLATQSFHETKNFTCGEGGALLVNEAGYIDRAEILREKGTDRSRFFRGQVDKYGWVDLGSSYLPSDLLAAFLLAQFEEADRLQSQRKNVWQRYHAALQGWAEHNNARLPVIPEHCEQSYHMYYVILPSLAARQDLIAHLKARGILAVFHYLPLHNSYMGSRAGKPGAECPVTEYISDRLLRLPFYNSLSEEDQAYVIAAILEWDTEC